MGTTGAGDVTAGDVTAGDVTRPLAGVRVLDLGQVVAGPLCAFHLAALGAEVIRVDRPGGDLSWRVGPFATGEGILSETPGGDGISLSHLRRGRGKRSVVLDLGSSQGRDVLRELVGACDVLIENFRPGVLQGWGLGHEELLAANPTLIHLAITGYGYGTRRQDHQAMDPIIQAVSGLMAKTGFPDGEPVRAGTTVGDQVPALFGALAVVAELGARPRRAAFLDMSMLDALTALLWDEPLDLFEDRDMPTRVGNADPRGAPMDSYPTRDGHVVIVGTNDAQWQRLCALMGRPELAERLATLPDRRDHRAEVNAAVRAWTSSSSTQAVLDDLLAADIPAGAVNEPAAARHDVDARTRGVLEPLRHRAAPERDVGLLGPRFPVLVDGETWSAEPAEALGASTESVLAEVLGYSHDAISRLRQAGTLG